MLSPSDRARGSPVAITASALFAYAHNSLYQALRRGADALGEEITDEDWLRTLQTERVAWLAQHLPPPLRDELGRWKIRILDATNHDRPQVTTVRVGYVHGADGMKPGLGLSVLAQRVGAGSWTLPLEIAWMPPEHGPTSFGAPADQSLCRHPRPARRSAYWMWIRRYTVRPFLKPVVAEGVNVLGRVRHNRCFYLPIKEYSGFGRPAQLGAKFKLNDPKTQPRADRVESWRLAPGGRIEARCRQDVRQQGWASQPLTLYQVIERRADGKLRRRRPLWLLFVAGKPRTAQQRPALAPRPRQADAIYDERFSIEHAIRFGKQERGLVSGQFNGLAAATTRADLGGIGRRRLLAAVGGAGGGR